MTHYTEKTRHASTIVFFLLNKNFEIQLFPFINVYEGTAQIQYVDRSETMNNKIVAGKH